MKELLKKASLAVASMCLVAGGLVSVGFAAGQEEKTERVVLSSYEQPKANEKQQAMPDELEVNGQKYKKVRALGWYKDWEPDSNSGCQHSGC